MLSLTELKRATTPALQRLRNQLERGMAVTAQAGSAFSPQLPAPVTELLPDTIAFSSKLGLAKSEALQLVHSTEVHRRLQHETGDWADTAVSSHVYITHDGHGEALPKSQHQILQVSIAGINWAYPQAQDVVVGGRHYVMASDLQHCHRDAAGNITADSIKWYKQRMLQKWGFLLEVMASRGVKVPILPAIGLGAFLPPGPAGQQVRQASAAALQECLLKHRQHDSFSQVWVAIPFGPENLAAFEAGAQSGSYTVTKKSMFDYAWELAGSAHVGIVNASDREALVSGNLGQFWAGGHVALEEVFPYVTTVLLNNWFYTRVPPKEADVDEC